VQYQMTSLRIHVLCRIFLRRKGAARPSARSTPGSGSVARSCDYTSHGGHMQDKHWAFLYLSHAAYM
jgi:hypothetical protein